MTDTEVKQKGLGALLDALGEVDAKRFITLLSRDLLITRNGNEVHLKAQPLVK